jgi:hypothetical protein
VLDRPQRPLFRRGEGRVDKGFTQIDLPAVSQVLGESLQQPVEAAGTLPALETTMAGLIRGITSGKIRPGSAGPEHPEDGVHDAAGISPGSAPSVRPSTRTEDRFEHGPLLVG